MVNKKSTATKLRDARLKLMATRDVAVKNRDWKKMNDITMKLASMPVPIAVVAAPDKSPCCNAYTSCDQYGEVYCKACFHAVDV